MPLEEKSDYITGYFYSNCLIEAIKAKLKNPKKIKISVLTPKYTECWFPCPHFMWSDGQHDFDFGVERYLHPWNVICFKGVIRRRKLGFNERYIARRKTAYEKKKANKKKEQEMKKAERRVFRG